MKYSVIISTSLNAFFSSLNVIMQGRGITIKKNKKKKSIEGVDMEYPVYLIHISHCFFSSLNVIMRFKAGTRDNNQKE